MISNRKLLLFAMAFLLPMLLQPAAMRGQASNSSHSQTAPQARPERALDIERQQAEKAFSRGDLTTSLRSYKKAIELGRNESTSVRAQAWLDYARVCDLGATDKVSAEFTFDEAANAYRRVIDIGNATQRLVAGNNLGTMLLKRSQAKAALDAFLLVEKSTDCDTKVGSVCVQRHFDESPQAYIYYYNVGRAFEADGNRTDALDHYYKALDKRLDFEPASNAAFDILLSTNPPLIRDVENLASRLIALGRVETASRRLHEALDRWTRNDEAQRLLAVLVRCYAESGLTPSAFDTDEWPVLHHWADQAPALQKAVDQIHLAFSGKFEPTFDPVAGRQRAEAWVGGDWRVKPYGMLLLKMGDYYRPVSPKDALARYALAWGIDPTNSNGALYAADVLLDDGAALDPDQKLFDQLFHSLSVEKTIAYLEQDWLTALRLRMVLANVFVRRQIWGPEDTPQSAAYQLERAQEAEKRFREENSKYTLSPGLHQQLAEVYLHLDKRTDAWDQYATASDAYLQSWNLKDARRMLERAKALNLPLDPKRMGTFASLDDAIRKKSNNVLGKRATGVA